MDSHGRKKLLLKSLKIAAGSGLAITLAGLLGLSYATSAGIIALLTVHDTKQGTIQLTVDRLLSFLMSACLIFVCFHLVPWDGIAYACYIFLMVAACTALGWQGTISVNAVVGTHYLMTPDYSVAFVINELMLLLIGTGMALLMNWRMPSYLEAIREDMREIENEMEKVLLGMASYLEGEKAGANVWEDLDRLELRLQKGLNRAREQADNSLGENDLYYVEYMEMRLQQCGMLQTLHKSVRKVRTIPKQAVYISRYLKDLAHYIHEIDIPGEQLWKLQDIFDQMVMEALPRSREEFENRAILFHVLMDLEEFLMVKQRFLENHQGTRS